VTLIPRDYQLECNDAVEAKLAEYDSTLVVMATGLGKTTLAAFDALRVPKRYMFIAHREELLRQTVEEMREVTGFSVGLEQAENYARPSDRVVVASVNTLFNPRRLRRFDPSDFGRVAADEAHHYIGAGAFGEVLSHFVGVPRLGLTATPRRADGVSLRTTFSSVAYELNIVPATEAGWLVPVRQKAVNCDSLDFSHLAACKDFSPEYLERVLTEEGPLQEMVYPFLELAGDRPSIVFTATVGHGVAVAKIIDRYRRRDGAALLLHGGSSQEDYDEGIRAFRAGSVQYLVNCNLFTEGFNVREVACIGMMRPTKSEALYLQMLGRGTRPLKGVVDGPATAEGRIDAIANSGKPDVLVVDFVGNAGRHKVLTASDALGGDRDPEVRARAARIAKDKPVMAADALDRAAAELNFIREHAEMLKRKSIVARSADYTVHDVPLGGAASAPSPTAKKPAGPAAPDWMVRKLVRDLGLHPEYARSCTQKQGWVLIGKYKRGEWKQPQRNH
jgi:superfamily II DNA or RNA helicase